jgi:hypothetical protein
MVIVQSLWVGNDLSDMEKYSIQSFLNVGHEFHLYTYEKIGGIPKGVKIKDGNEIMPAAEIFRLKETFLPFSDIFRYKMLYEKGHYWVDLDLICIKKLDFKDEFVFSSERTIQKGAYKMKVKYVPNIGVLKAPAKSPFYKELYEKCLEYHKKGINKDKIKYMRILREAINNYGYMKYVKSPDYFCHLDWWYAKDAFLPLDKYRPKYGVRGKTIREMFYGKNVYTIHLWRDLVTKKYKLDTNGKYDPTTLWERQKRFVDNGSKFPVDMNVLKSKSKSISTGKTKKAQKRTKRRSKLRQH